MSTTPDPDFLQGGGRAGALIRDHSWQNTSLGSPQTWPQPLRAGLRLLLNHSQPMCLLWGPDLISFCNDEYGQQVGGTPPPGLPGQTLFAHGWEAMTPKITHVLAGHGGARNENVPLAMIKNGQTRTSYWTYSYGPLEDPAAQHRVGGILVVCTETTAAMLAQEAREESARQRRHYEAILTNTPDLAYVWNLEHRFIYANEGLLHMWGRTSAEAIGKTCLELGYEPWHAQMHDCEIEQVVATRKPVRGEVPFNGTLGRRMYDYILVPVLNAAGEVEAVAGTTRDTTERQQTELRLRQLAQELLESDQRKTQFLATLAHELRNPLAPIRNALHIIQTPGIGEPLMHSSIDIMQRQLSQLVRLVDDLIDISRINRGKISLRHEHVDLGALLQRAIETSRPMIESAAQQLVVERPAQPILVRADPVRLAQVISNLLNNASKFSSPGTKIFLTARREEAAAVISVRDEGVGIPPGKLKDIFGMFAQLESGSESPRSGLGVGLALVKTLVEMHGGRVEGTSAGPGLGSEFSVWLPLLPSDADVAPESEGVRPVPFVTGRRVLVVDDNRDSANTMARILQLSGNVTCTVHDGLTAVESAERFQPELVLLDLGLPGLNGYEVCRRILQRLPTKPTIVALTGWGDTEDRKLSAEAGFAAHLVKPVDHTVLARVLRELLPPWPEGAQAHKLRSP